MQTNPLLKKCSVFGITIFTSLVIFSVFISSVTADNVTITIKGGFGCTVTIQNNENYFINASISIVSHKIFSEGGGNSSGHGPITPNESVSLTLSPPGIETINATAKAENQTVMRKGISFFHFVILFKE
jgi:hypothetical protein